MRHYFEAEMRILHEAAQTFAKTYPEQARLLNLQIQHDRDPYIERLLEGVAYLTAHIKQRINDQLPDISANLITQFWPQILRPYPSAMIMQFNSKPGQLTQTYLMPAHTQLKTPALGEEQIICQFRTVYPVKIQPLHVINAKIQTSTTGAVISIHLQSDTHVDINQLDLQDLPIYINAEINITLSLFYALTKQANTISVIIPRGQAPQILLKNCNIIMQPCHLNPQDSILPNCHRTFSGFSLILDYFCFREKYFFVSISGLNKITWPPNTKQFIIEIKCKNDFAMDYAISEKNILLNCVPAVNLYPSTSEPIQINHQRTEYPLIVDATSRKGLQLFSVDSVSGIETKSGKQYQYESLYDFKFLQKQTRFYAVNYQDHGIDILQPYLNIGGVPIIQTEILSCNLTVCNGYYPRRYLSEYTVHQLCNTTSNFTALNITRPTSIIYPPTHHEWQWLLISHLSLNYNTLGNITVFQQLLRNYCWSNNEVNMRRISAIRLVDIQPLQKMHKGILMRGIIFCITLDESGYLSIEDIYLFGEMMQQFLSAYAQFNTYVQLKIICLPSQREIIWNMKPGLNPLI